MVELRSPKEELILRTLPGETDRVEVVGVRDRRGGADQEGVIEPVHPQADGQNGERQPTPAVRDLGIPHIRSHARLSPTTTREDI